MIIKLIVVRVILTISESHNNNITNCNSNNSNSKSNSNNNDNRVSGASGPAISVTSLARLPSPDASLLLFVIVLFVNNCFSLLCSLFVE